MDALKTYDYLTRVRQRMLDAIRSLTPQQYQREFPFGLKTIGSTLAHIMVSEWYYIERLEGRPVPPYDQWPIKYEHPPDFDSIENAWCEQSKSVRASIAAQRDWNRKVVYDSFPADDGKRYHVTATTGEFFMQLALHEVHHRSQILAMLRQLGKPLEDLDYNILMFDRREIKA